MVARKRIVIEARNVYRSFKNWNSRTVMAQLSLGKLLKRFIKQPKSFSHPDKSGYYFNIAIELTPKFIRGCFRIIKILKPLYWSNN